MNPGYRYFSFALAACASVVLLGAGPVEAQPASGEPAIRWMVGVGPSIRPDYEGSQDYEPLVAGTFQLNWADGKYVHLRSAEGSGAAPRMEANLVPDGPVIFGPLVQYRLKRGDVESSRVSGLKTQDGAVEIGGFLGFTDGDWTLRSSVASDVSDEHNGTLVSLSVNWARAFTKHFSVGADVQTTWASGGYMGSYFSIGTQNAARSGLKTYDADDGFKDVGFGLFTMWGLESWEHFRIAGKMSYFRLIEDAEDSPVVDDAGSANQFFGGLMLVWMQ